MKHSILQIDKEILALNQKRDRIQERCKHLKVEKSHHADTGNYDPRDNSYWTCFHCLNCDKKWVEEGSH